jgi:hypothetical protein
MHDQTNAQAMINEENRFPGLIVRVKNTCSKTVKGKHVNSFRLLKEYLPIHCL